MSYYVLLPKQVQMFDHVCFVLESQTHAVPFSPGGGHLPPPSTGKVNRVIFIRRQLLYICNIYE